MAEKKETKPPGSPPPGFKKVKEEYWEAVDPHRKRPAVNKHTGVYAYHADDCMCGMAGWPCFREGSVWSCCGQTEKYCKCTKEKK
jgi:hypothetical protein